MRVSVEAAAIRAAIRTCGAGDDAQAAVIRALRDQVDALETALGIKDADLYPRALPAAQRGMLGMLLKRASVSKEQFLQAIYAGRNGADLPNDPSKVLDVQMCRLRRCLKRDGIEIETVRGARGHYDAATYRLAPAAKAKVREIMSASTAKAAA